MFKTVGLTLLAVSIAASTSFILEPAQAQDKGATDAKMTVAGRPILPTGDLQALLEKRESWGDEPSQSTAGKSK